MSYSVLVVACSMPCVLPRSKMNACRLLTVSSIIDGLSGAITAIHSCVVTPTAVKTGMVFGSCCPIDVSKVYLDDGLS